MPGPDPTSKFPSIPFLSPGEIPAWNTPPVFRILKNFISKNPARRRGLSEGEVSKQADKGSQAAANLMTLPCGSVHTPCEIQPTSEFQIRPFTTLEPEQQRTVWKEAVKTAPAGLWSWPTLWIPPKKA